MKQRFEETSAMIATVPTAAVPTAAAAAVGLSLVDGAMR
jgi:hypothetical protein